MSRSKVYINAAERQRAYRQRLATSNPTQPVRIRRRLSRPARLSAVLLEVETLRDEYAGWLANIPDPLADTGPADLLAEAVEQLQTAVEILAGIHLPRGFGRD